MLTKAQLVPVLSLAVTLTVAQALKLHLKDALTLAGFSESWLIALKNYKFDINKKLYDRLEIYVIYSL